MFKTHERFYVRLNAIRLNAQKQSRRCPMKRHRISVTAFLLALSVCAFTGLSRAQTQTARRPASRAAANPSVPAEYQAGIAELRVAKGYLEKAGDKWGGYRIKGIAAIDQTFKTFGVSPESSRNEMQSGNVDEPGMMDSGVSSLQTARSEIADLSNDWDGRQQTALNLIDQALGDLQTGINWAKEHHTY
jgi:hypothetical protein